jgi:hypothetical protein
MNFNSLTACAVTSIGLMALGFHGDASAISYSKAGTNSAFSASWEEATTINYTGAPIERSASGSNHNGTETVFASANLSTGKLKGLAGGTGTYINASSQAAFGDSLTILNADDLSLFSWKPDSSARLSVKISGRVTDTLGVRSLVQSDGTSPNELYTLFNLSVMRPGYLELWRNLNDLYAYARTDEEFAEIRRISNELDSLTISSKSAFLGRPVFFDQFNNDYVKTCGCVSSINTGSATINLDFMPQGNFEFMASMHIVTRLGDNQGEHTLIQDFSHTIGLEFVGPPGSITYANSGAFPGTVTTVPEPSTWMTMFIGILGLAMFFGKTTKSRITRPLFDDRHVAGSCKN